MAPFDRLYTTSYDSVTVSIALSCTISEIFNLEEYRDLEIFVRSHSLYDLIHDLLIGEIYYRPGGGAVSCRSITVVCLSSFIHTQRVWKEAIFGE